MKKLFILFAYFYALNVFAGLPIPKDQNNTPMYSAQSFPSFTNGVTFTTASYVSWLTLPSTGDSYQRIFKHIVVYNPDPNRTVFVCFGGSVSCATDSMAIPPAMGIALDDIVLGYTNSITTIWGRLDNTGSVIPQLTVW